MGEGFGGGRCQVRLQPGVPAAAGGRELGGAQRGDRHGRRRTLLVEAQQQGRLARKLAWLARCDVVILDELGYVPFDKAGADLLFDFISQRYERRSLVVTTNLPFARWSEVFLDPTAAAAVIDRIVHHAAVLQTTGDSYRLAAAKRNHKPAAGKKGAR